MMQVVPPQAAAIEPVFQSSAEVVPMKGMSMCVWGSMAPGQDVLAGAVDGLVGLHREPGADRLDPVALQVHVRHVRSRRRDDQPVLQQHAHVAPP